MTPAARPRHKTRRAAAAPRVAAPPPALHLCFVRSPVPPIPPAEMDREIVVATYNVHRWTGLNGRSEPDPARAAFVISELGADVIALQEVFRPFHGEDPLVRVADALGLHLAFAATRVHRQGGEIGNAILARFPIQSVSTLDLSFSRLERRVAVAARVGGGRVSLGIVATHLALVDRTRKRQVSSLLGHPELVAGPTILLGDMNAWRRCAATRALDRELRAHTEAEWPASFPAARPILALDRVYARGARILELHAHETPAARRASDHLPVVARVELPAPN